LWIVIGSIFFGAVHDFGAIVGSIRHKALSIGELVNQYVGHRGKILFNLFAWLTLVLVVANFLELAAAPLLVTLLWLSVLWCTLYWPSFLDFWFTAIICPFCGLRLSACLLSSVRSSLATVLRGAVNVCDECLYVAMDSHLLHFRGFSSSCMDSASAS